MRLYLVFLIFTALFITGCYVRLSRAGERDFTRPPQSQSFFDRDGHFRGSSIDTKQGSSFYDRSGNFSGTAIKNSDGTTSFYDKGGHFTGSSSNTSQPR
jgi:hypothetical protein